MFIFKLFFLAATLTFTPPITNSEPAPDFEFFHEKGEFQKLSDYKGKVVYVSFWASWCKPCLSNYQKYNSMRKEMKEMGVVLLNVSLDRDKASWERALKSYSFLNGENVHVTDLRKVMDLYQLSTIPEYRILNKNLEEVYLEDNSNRDVLSSFKKWVEEVERP